MDIPTAGLPIGETTEIQPGVVIERRCFLTLAAAALATIAAPGAALAQMRDRKDRLTFEEFLAQVVPVAKQLVADETSLGQDRYLLTLASFAVRLSEVPLPSEWRDSTQGTGPGTWIGFNPGGDPFIVLHWRMEPGTEIRTHAHTYGNVCTVGLEGSVRVRNYEMVGERDFDAKGRFKVRQTQDQILTPGRINLVPLEHDYIHGFVAGRGGGRGLDITTRLKERRPTPYLELAEKPLDAEQRIYEGGWTI